MGALFRKLAVEGKKVKFCCLQKGQEGPRHLGPVIDYLIDRHEDGAPVISQVLIDMHSQGLMNNQNLSSSACAPCLLYLALLFSALQCNTVQGHCLQGLPPTAAPSQGFQVSNKASPSPPAPAMLQSCASAAC